MRRTLSLLWRRWAIISLGLTLLAGCSAVRLGYNQAPQLAYWWLDDYLDFNAEQAPRVREALADWLAWHRQTQLADYAAALARARAEAQADVSPEQMCRWNDELRERLDPAIERIIPLAADIAVTLTAGQISHLESRLRKANEKFRKEQLQSDPAERHEAAAQRLIERYESFYGRLDASQRRVLTDSVTGSPYDAEVWSSERLARQRDLLVALRSLAASRPEPAKAQAVLRAMARRFDGSVQGPLQAARARLTQHHCLTATRLHNSASAAQRQDLRKKLAGWESDLRLLATDGPQAGPPIRLGSR